jgi:hypothetical protein
MSDDHKPKSEYFAQPDRHISSDIECMFSIVIGPLKAAEVDSFDQISLQGSYCDATYEMYESGEFKSCTSSCTLFWSSFCCGFRFKSIWTRYRNDCVEFKARALLRSRDPIWRPELFQPRQPFMRVLMSPEMLKGAQALHFD